MGKKQPRKTVQVRIAADTRDRANTYKLTPRETLTDVVDRAFDYADSQLKAAQKAIKPKRARERK